MMCVMLLSMIIVSAHADASWNFNMLSSKMDAANQILQKWSAIKPSDFASPLVVSGQAMTPGQLMLSDMYANHLSTYNFSLTSYKGSFDNFCQNMANVYAINSDPTQTWFASGNAFSGFSFNEFSAMRLMNLPDLMGSIDPQMTSLGWSKQSTPPPRKLLMPPPMTPTKMPPMPPSSSTVAIDWVAAGKVTPVKDQGQCGSCWAFSAIATLESSLLIKNSSISASNLNLSEQQLVSCATSTAGYGSLGCNGGYSDQALRYIYGNAEAYESSYPYTAASSACKSSQSGQTITVAGAVTTTQTLVEAAFVTAMSKAPFAFYFAVAPDFQNYAGGVYTPSATCGSMGLNHAMTAVGYSKTDSAWLVKNSWGTSWGAMGYVQIKATGNGNGACNMYTHGAMQ